MQIIPIASGKGGVGKSLLAANLAIALGQTGKRVVIADLDLGASNLHLVLGQNATGESLGTWLTDKSEFSDIVKQTEYLNVKFIAGDSQIPGLTALKPGQVRDLIDNLASLRTDYLIIDLGAGTHQIILDLFLLSPQGIVVSAPTVTATLNAYLFLKNAVFRLMYTTFKRGSAGYRKLEELRNDSSSLQKLYIPELVKNLHLADPENTDLFEKRMMQFRPRLVLNMIDDPKDADKAQRIRRSCTQYLGLDIEMLGIVYRDSMQDRALASRLPVISYKPQSVISQAVYRIAEKIYSADARTWDSDYKLMESDASFTFEAAEEEANEDFAFRMSSINDLLGSNTLTKGELTEMIRTQQYELTQIKKENLLLKSKLIKAAKLGFKV